MKARLYIRTTKSDSNLQVIVKHKGVSSSKKIAKLDLGCFNQEKRIYSSGSNLV